MTTKRLTFQNVICVYNNNSASGHEMIFVVVSSPSISLAAQGHLSQTFRSFRDSSFRKYVYTTFLVNRG